MPNEITELTRQYTTLLEQLEETEANTSELQPRLAACCRQCMECLRQWKKSITTNGFSDRDTEIHFFKRIKPAIAGRHIYYKRVHQLHLGELKGCWIKERERLSMELDTIAKVFKQHESLWQYYQSGATALDDAYFLRAYNDWMLMPLSTDYDEDFSTCGDGQLAELIGLELLMQYIVQLLKAGESPIQELAGKDEQPKVVFTGLQAEFNELVYFLHAGGIFNHGTVTIKDLKECCEMAWHFKAKHFYRHRIQNAERKEPMRLIKRLVDMFRRHLDDRID